MNPSPKEVAKEVLDNAYESIQEQDEIISVTERGLLEAIATAISNAVEDEREACAKLIDEMSKDRNFCECYENSHELGEAIRARSKKEVKP